MPTIMRNLHSSFVEFWPEYLRAHRKGSTRLCHYIATVVGACVGFYGIFTFQPLVFMVGILAGYVIAVSSHYVFEGRKPLVLRNPVWGAISDLRMFALALAGRLAAEFQKHQIRQE